MDFNKGQWLVRPLLLNLLKRHFIAILVIVIKTNLFELVNLVIEGLVDL